MAAPGPAEPLTKLRFGDFSAWVLVNELPAKIYKVESTNKRTAAYIESVEDAPFSVHLLDDQMGPEYGISGSVFVDGKESCNWAKAASSSLYQKRKGHDFRRRDVGGWKTSSTSELPTKFNSIVLTDDGDVASSSTAVKQLGKIEIRLFRIREVKPSEKDVALDAVADDTPLHERAVKTNLSHRVSLGETRECRNGAAVTTERIDPKHDPLHVFEFRYLSRALLELKGIVQTPLRITRKKRAPVASGSTSHAPDAASTSGTTADPRARPQPTITQIELSPTPPPEIVATVNPLKSVDPRPRPPTMSIRGLGKRAVAPNAPPPPAAADSVSPPVPDLPPDSPPPVASGSGSNRRMSEPVPIAPDRADDESEEGGDDDDDPAVARKRIKTESAIPRPKAQTDGLESKGKGRKTVVKGEGSPRVVKPEKKPSAGKRRGNIKMEVIIIDSD